MKPSWLSADVEELGETMSTVVFRLAVRARLDAQKELSCNEDHETRERYGGFRM